MGIHFLSLIPRKLLVINLLRVAEIFTFSTPAALVSVLADIARYAALHVMQRHHYNDVMCESV